MADIAVTVTVALLVAFMPGLAVIRQIGGSDVLPRYSLLPTALLLSTAIHAMGTLVGLALDVPITTVVYVTVGLAAVTLAIRAMRADGRRYEIVRSGRQFLTIIVMLVIAMAAAVVAGGAPLGGRLSDTLLHLGIITKIAETPVVDVQQLAFFPDGIPHPTYIVPVWHAMIAASATGEPQQALLALDVFTVLVTGVAVLSWLVLSRVLIPNDVLALTAAAGMTVVRIVSTAPEFRLAQTIGYPGNMALEVAFPITLACLVWSVGVRRTRDQRIAACSVMGIGIVLLVLLHANYVLYVVAAGVGYLVARACLWRYREDWSKHVAPMLVVAVAGLGTGVPLLAQLRTLERFGRGTGDEQLEQVQGNWAQALTVSDGQLVLDPGYYLALGGLVLVGLLAVVLLAWLPVERVATTAILCGGVLGILGMALIPSVLTALAGAGDATFVIRAHRGLVLMPAVVLVLAYASTRISTRGIPVAVLVSATVGVAAAFAPNRLSGRDQTLVTIGWVPGEVISLAAVAVGVGLLLQVFRSQQRGWGDPSVMLTVALCSCIFLPSAAVGLARYPDAPNVRPDDGPAREGLALPEQIRSRFGERVADAPYEYHVVAAEPHTSYSIQGFFPVYVTSVNKLKLASGGELTNPQRVSRWDTVTAPDADRAAIQAYLDDAHATMVIVPARAVALREYLRAQPGWEQINPTPLAAFVKR